MPRKARTRSISETTNCDSTVTEGRGDPEEGSGNWSFTHSSGLDIFQFELAARVDEIGFEIVPGLYHFWGGIKSSGYFPECIS